MGLIHGSLNGPETHDLYLILRIDAVITATHIASPVRWVLLIPSQLAGTVVYLVLACSFGSPDPASVIINFILTAMVFAASAGLRSAEVRERAVFLSLFNERSLRAHAEHMVDHLTSTSVARDTEASSIVTGQG